MEIEVVSCSQYIERIQVVRGSQICRTNQWMNQESLDMNRKKQRQNLEDIGMNREVTGL